MIGQYEEDPEPVRKKFIDQSSLENVSVGKINVFELTGKRELP